MVALSIGLSGTNFSKYDPECSTIQVWGAVDSGHQHQNCTVSLLRNDVYGLVVSHVLPNIGATWTTSFDLNSSEVNDSDGINRVVEGDYTVTATLADTTTVSLPCTISIVSVRELRHKWLYGLTTLSSEVILPRQQPQLIAAEIVFVSPAYVKDAYDLQYVLGSTPTLSFGNGPAKPIVPNSGIQTVILLDEHEEDYVQVKINTFLLPNENVSETLVLDQAEIPDKDFIQQERLATAYIESRLGWWVEPHLVISERLKIKYPKYEYIRDGASFYDDFNQSTGVFPNISLPLQQLLVVKDLEGYYNLNPVLKVPAVWIQTGAFQQGNIELVPTSGQASALVWQSFPFAFSTMQTRVVPSFWQYSVVAGLPDLHREREIIRELIAKKCGIDLALMIADAYKAGVTAESTSRDNISISRSYSTSAMYSVLAHITLPWTDFLKEELPKARARFGGLPIVTMV